MTIRNYLLLSIILLVLTCGAIAQDLPTVEVTLSQSSARRDDVVTANVYIRSNLEIIGADIEITVDETCLQIEGRDVGDYFPPGDGESVTIFEETTDNSTRLAMNVLNFDRIPTADGLFYSVPLRVVCDEADVTVDVTFAHLVQRGIIDFKAADGRVDLLNTTLTISPTAQQEEETDQPSEQTVATSEPTVVDQPAETPDQEVASTSPVLVMAIVMVIGALIGLFLLIIYYRRSRRRK